MVQIQKQLLIWAPLHEVYELARDPKRWALWLVGLSEPKSLVGEGEVGTVSAHDYLLMGKPFPVIYTVLEDCVTTRGAYWRTKIEGPFAGEYSWKYFPKRGGTKVSAELSYTVPRTTVGKAADPLVVERLQERALEHSLTNLKMICEKSQVAS